MPMGSTASIPVIELGPIARRLGLPAAGVEAVALLLDAGNTVPFITRYRRDQTGGLDEEDVRRIAGAVARARQLAERKQTILRTVQGQGKLTPDLEARIAAADNAKQLEDLYLPFKPRKLSLAEVAKQRRLEPLAREILAADAAALDLDRRAGDFIDADAQVATVADVLLGVGHIIAHEYAERADLRQRLRDILFHKAALKSQRMETAGKPLSKDEKHYRDYFEYAEHVQRVPPHRVLAINRGERARIIKVRIEGPLEEMLAVADEMLVPAGHPHAEFLRGCARDALSRLVLPSLEREVRREMTEFCEAHAVAVFARNLRNLLLQPPVSGRRVLALDPGFKSGCKAVVIDECGTPLEHAVLHIIGQPEKRAAAARRIVELVTAHGCNVIAVGNGTAGRDTETLVAELVAGELQSLDVAYVIVNEAGASVYSTSQYGREELPNHEAAVRGAISIGRRLQDPLSELVKIEPANIGVGLYQHDVRARHLHASLDTVVESCVNYVGVDANTASPALLRYVSGLNQATARNIHDWRTKNGPFRSRQQFMEVPGFGEAAFVQAVGFLKISGGDNPLDATWIHPESYAIAERVLERLGGSPADLAGRQQAGTLAERAAAVDLEALAGELGVGRLLLADIIEQLARPGRDPREDLPRPFFKKGVLKLEDLEVGMELSGAILNVVDFGAFVDFGMHDSGLVHISQLSSRYVRDPHDVVSVGQIVKVWVLELDKSRRRVALTMISPAERERQQRARDQKAERRKGGGRPGRRQAAAPAPSGAGESPAAAGAVAAPTPTQAAPRPPRRPPPERQDRPAQPRPPRDRPARGQPSRERRAAEPPARVYQSSKAGTPPPPISKGMREGREPLRTFGDLKQFFDTRAEPEPLAEARPMAAKAAVPVETVQPVETAKPVETVGPATRSAAEANPAPVASQAVPDSRAEAGDPGATTAPGT